MKSETKIYTEIEIIIKLEVSKLKRPDNLEFMISGQQKFELTPI